MPHDGHWRFIVACAEIAKIGLHVRDIKVKAGELDDAILEAGLMAPVLSKREQKEYNADDTLQLKERLGL